MFLDVYWPFWTSLYHTDIQIQQFTLSRASTMLNIVFHLICEFVIVRSQSLHNIKGKSFSSFYSQKILVISLILLTLWLKAASGHRACENDRASPLSLPASIGRLIGTHLGSDDGSERALRGRWQIHRTCVWKKGKLSEKKG